MMKNKKIFICIIILIGSYQPETFRQCCLVYSQIHNEPATCTFNDLIIPNCSISIHVSMTDNNSCGIPDVSLLKIKKIYTFNIIINKS